MQGFLQQFHLFIHFVLVILTVLSILYTKESVYKLDHKECYFNYLWCIIGTYCFVLCAYIFMIYRTIDSNLSVIKDNLHFCIIMFVLALVNLYCFMIIVWVVDTTYSSPFYSNFTKWSLHIDDNVENKVFYRIGEGVVKFYSVILLVLGFSILSYILGDRSCKRTWCEIINYKDDSSKDDSGEDDFAEDYFGEEDKKGTGHNIVMSTPASISFQL